MKKNLFILMVGFFVLCFSPSVTSAKSSALLDKANNTISKESIQGKLKEIKLSLNKGKKMCNSVGGDCIEGLAYLVAAAELAVAICGADGSNYESYSCQIALSVANELGEEFIDNGCGGMLGGGTVTAINPKKKIWLMKKQFVRIA